MKYILNKFLANRDALAVATFVAGLPFIYFLRDGVKLAPANTFFGVFFLFFPYALSLIFKDLKTFDAPNKVGFTLLSWFIIIGLTYFLLRDRYTAVNGVRELLNFTLIFIIYFGTVFIKRESLNKNFPFSSWCGFSYLLHFYQSIVSFRATSFHNFRRRRGNRRQSTYQFSWSIFWAGSQCFGFKIQ